MTITRIMCGCAVFAFAVAATSAQTKNTTSGTCAKADVEHSVPAGDNPSHAFMVAQGKCTAKGMLGSSQGVFSEHRDVTATRLKAWGVFIETFESGDKITYNYELSVSVKVGAMGAGKGTFYATDGTGKMKGIKARGNCTYSAGSDGGTNYSCNGDYTLAAAMAK
jgi:hypothetical protein